LRGPNTIPEHGQPGALLAGVAVLAIAALVALMVWVGPLGLGGAETKDAVRAAGAGSAVILPCGGVSRPGIRPWR
jgi:hypothetical protein